LTRTLPAAPPHHSLSCLTLWASPLGPKTLAWPSLAWSLWATHAVGYWSVSGRRSREQSEEAGRGAWPTADRMMLQPFESRRRCFWQRSIGTVREKNARSS
jgi:hypothetical protein